MVDLVSLNIIPLSTLEALAIPQDIIIKQLIEVSGIEVMHLFSRFHNLNLTTDM